MLFALFAVGLEEVMSMRVRVYKNLVQALPVLLFATSAWSQTCNLPIELSAPDSRFQLDPSDSGVVTDIRTGLSWQRCPVGRQIDDANTDFFADDSCPLVDQNPLDSVADNEDGDPDNDVALTYSWYEALDFAENTGNAWRMPNLKELASLVEYACEEPAINSNVFPNTAQGLYWSSTPNAVNDASAWTIDFEDGEDGPFEKNINGFVLLVSD